MWEQVPLPEIKSTIRACSLPDRSGTMVIWTDKSVYRVRFHPSPATLVRMYSVKDAEKKFVAERGGFASNGSQMHGDCGRHGWHSATDLQSVHPHGFTVEIDEKQNRVHLLDPAGNICLTVDSVNVKSRLLIAHFNDCHMHRKNWSCFVVCDSTSLRVYDYRQPSVGVPAKWSTSSSRESQQSLWNAVIENPDDDTPRLIYADWLEENGDRDRAEFIRLQCRIAERESLEFIPPDDPDIVRNEQIQNQHGERWVGETGKITGIYAMSSFWRGFPESIILRSSLLTRKSHQQTILASSPFEYVFLSLFRIGECRRLEKCELTSRWRNIVIESDPDFSPDYIQLFKSPRLNRLRKVAFTGWFGQELNLALVSNSPFPQLHTLAYINIDCTDPAINFSVLGGTKTLPQLKNVIFNDNNVFRPLQEREDIRQLASRVENVYQVLWVRGKPTDFIKLKA